MAIDVAKRLDVYGKYNIAYMYMLSWCMLLLIHSFFRRR